MNKKAEICAIIEPYFDKEFYLERNRDVAESEMSVLEHYVMYGEAEGRHPTPGFDPATFKSIIGNKSARDDNLFRIFVEEYECDYGLFSSSSNQESSSRREFLERIRNIIFTKFDENFYLDRYGDVKSDGGDPLDHYILHGESEGRQPNSVFLPKYFSSLIGIKSGKEVNLFALFLTEYGGVYPDETTDTKMENDYEKEISSRASDIRPFVDSVFYAKQWPKDQQILDPATHYLKYGEPNGFLPTVGFDPSYYLSLNSDLKENNVSPFWHYVKFGKAEGRIPCSYLKLRNEPSFLVSVIVPNFNHAKFLPERLKSIFNQSYKNVEIVILDDCSTDNSIQILEDAKGQSPFPIRTYYNDHNSGNVFKQWRRGIQMARGDLIWICESDDTCEFDFLEKIVHHFNNESVMLAFGAIQFCDNDGQYMEGLDAYRESAHPGIWSEARTRPAAEWFASCLGVKNVISNVGGCVFRRMELPAPVWKYSERFKIAGDWYLYSEIAGSGCIAFEPRAVSYFRQHGNNTSASNFTKKYYYCEHEMIGVHLAKMFGLPHETRLRLIDKIQSEFEANGGQDQGFLFSDVFNVDRLIRQKRTRLNVQIGSMGFTPGGGEIFPIVVANALQERGHLVSLVSTNMLNVEPSIRNRLRKSVPVFDASEILMEGPSQYFQSRGIDVLNTHNVLVDSIALRNQMPDDVALIPTLHGSHDVVDVKAPTVQELFQRMGKRADAWIYTADKNLFPFEKCELRADQVHKLNNSMPRDIRPFPKSRLDLGISEDAVVFTFVARGVERKGWRAMVLAFLELKNRHVSLPMHLLLVGTGEKEVEARELVRESDPVTFLGYDDHINGLYKISDCAVVPSRFPGESNPLCLIQAIQEGIPIIATDIGEIVNMVSIDGVQMALILDLERDTKKFSIDLCSAMEEILDSNVRQRLRDGIIRLKPKFDLSSMIDEYEHIFRQSLLSRRGS